MNKLFYLSDDEVQSQLAAKCNLLVHIGMETFQYVIIDNVRDQLKVIAEFDMPAVNNTAEIIEAIGGLPESSKQFKYSFNSVKVSFDTFNYTFIPAELYLEEDHQDYAKYLGHAGSSREVIVNNIRSAEIKNIVAIDAELRNALNRIFHKPKIYNQAAPFLEGVQKALSGEDQLACCIDVGKKHFQAAVLKDRRLEFYNSFEFVNADEFNYFLLSMIKSLEIQTEQTHIIVSGKISEDDEIYKRIQKYFTRIRFANATQSVKYPEKFEEVRSHTYFSLISLDLCE